jgi:hypothetical protein
MTNSIIQSTIAEPGVDYRSNSHVNAAFDFLRTYPQWNNQYDGTVGFVVVDFGSSSRIGSVVYIETGTAPSEGDDVLLSSNNDSGYPAIIRKLVRETETTWHVDRYDEREHYKATRSIIRKSDLPRCHVVRYVVNPSGCRHLAEHLALSAA